MAQRPVAIGLILCEQVIIEEKTGNITPVNCFSHRTISQIPSEVFPFVVLAFLTDGLGKVNIEVAIQRLDTLDVIYRRSNPFTFINPLHQVRCMIRIRDRSFPVAGHYQVSIYADKELVAQRKLVVSEDLKP